MRGKFFRDKEVIKAIIFDFFGVICSDEYWQFVGEDKNFKAGFHQLADSVNLGKIDWQDFINEVAEETGQDVEAVIKLYESEKINPRLLAYVAKLHKTYKTAILTNASADFLEPLADRFHLDRLFDEIIISSKLGIIKPDPRIFEHTLKALDTRPAEAVFIDDISYNIEAAAELGMLTIFYENFTQMKEELEELVKE